MDSMDREETREPSESSPDKPSVENAAGSAPPSEAATRSTPRRRRRRIPPLLIASIGCLALALGMLLFGSITDSRDGSLSYVGAFAQVCAIVPCTGAVLFLVLGPLLSFARGRQ